MRKLKYIIEYLLSGDEPEDYQTESYEERIHKAYRNFVDEAEKHQITEESDLHRAFTEAVTAYEYVYMEIGVRAGFQLAMDILGNREGANLDGEH